MNTGVCQRNCSFREASANSAKLGKVFVADATNHKVVAFDLPSPRGVPRLFIRSEGRAPEGSGRTAVSPGGQMDSPWRMACDPTNSFIYVFQICGRKRPPSFTLGGAITTVAGTGAARKTDWEGSA